MTGSSCSINGIREASKRGVDTDNCSEKVYDYMYLQNY